MARKIKKPKPPPLAIWDKAIYGVLILGCFALFLLLLGLFDRLQAQAIAARTDPQTRLAAPTQLWFALFPVLSPLTLFFLLLQWMPMPIFGKPGIAMGAIPIRITFPCFPGHSRCAAQSRRSGRTKRANPGSCWAAWR